MENDRVENLRKKEKMKKDSLKKKCNKEGEALQTLSTAVFMH